MQPKKRKLSKRQLAALRRQRRLEKLRAAALILFAVVVCVAVAAFVLRPRQPDDVEMALASRATPEPTAAPVLAETSPEVSVEPEVSAEPEVSVEPEVSAEPELRSVRLRAVGDIMCTEGQLGFAKAAGGGSGYDFTSQFALIADALSNADYTMGNLETTIGKYKDLDYSGYPAFNSPECLLQTISDAGVDFFTMANNHMLDRWFDGLKATVGYVEAYGFDHCGAYRTREERATPVIVEIGGIRFGFVSYTTSANGREESSDAGAKLYGVPFFSSADIEGDVQRLRAAGAEFVIAFPHWGTEYATSPDSTQRKYAQKLIDAGVDAIIGSHPHVLQPMGFVTAGEGDSARDVLVAFSMGNFISTQNHSGTTDASMILEFTVQEQPGGGFAIEDVGFLPTYCWNHDNTLQVVASGDYLNGAPDGMDSKTYARMCATYMEIVNNYGADFALLTE